MGAIKYVYIGIAVAMSIGLSIALMTYSNVDQSQSFTPEKDTFSNITMPSLERTQALKKFSSQDELRTFLLKVLERQNIDAERFGLRQGRAPPFPDLDASLPLLPPSELPAKASEGAVEYGSGIADFATTNVQVQNVDEPDFLKNDGRYVYILKNDKLTIIDAYPPENARVITKVGLDVQAQNLQNLFLNKDRLVIFYQSSDQDYIIEPYGYRPISIYSPKTHAVVLDISDRESPKVAKNYEVTGYYHDARMIGEHVYFITRSDIDYRHPIVPSVMESSRTVMAPDVYYFDNPDLYYTFNTIAALDVFGGKINADTFMIDSAGTIYVSEDSIYITYPEYLPYTYSTTQSKEKFFNIIVPLLLEVVQEKIKSIESSNLDADKKWSRISELLQATYNGMPEKRDKLFDEIQRAVQDYESRLLEETQRTVIHKIAVDRLALSYSSKAQVPGHVLNQFSVDEFGNKFRIATTSEFYTHKGMIMHNNVYVLDEKLNMLGKLEKIAPDERIYSARFMGDKLYLVTFRQIDPFFVIDLSTETPKVLGYLKIPGFSNYLHPYDDNHIIGIGREGTWGGVKISLFDVSEVSNPVEVGVFVIGDQATNSEVLHNHKAFLFDKSKNVLSIPIESYSYNPHTNPWRGFYVLGVDAKDGFTLKGKVDHSSSGYDYGYGSRSFYIGGVLYTVTSNLMKMNDLKDMSEINEIKFTNTGEAIKYLD